MRILEVSNLKAYYGKALILRGINLHVDKGETVAIIGPNGAGKTTLFRSIMGLVKTDGTIKFIGRDITKLKPYERSRLGIAVCPEGRRLFPDMTVEDNLRIAARGGDIEKRLEEIYDLFPEIERRRKHLAKHTSGGEQQMIAIGRALMARPKFLMLDEPSMGLAPIVLLRLRNALQRIKESMGIEMLLIEQNVKLAFELADRVYVMVKGQITREGDVESIREVEKEYFEQI